MGPTSAPLDSYYISYEFGMKSLFLIELLERKTTATPNYQELGFRPRESIPNAQCFL